MSEDRLVARQRAAVGRTAVELVGAERSAVAPHDQGGWPEFTITLRYLVSTDDPDAAERAAREFFESTDFRMDSDAS